MTDTVATIDEGFIDQDTVVINEAVVPSKHYPFTSIKHIVMLDAASREVLRDVLELARAFGCRFEYNASHEHYPWRVVFDGADYHSSHPDDVLYHLMEIAEKVCGVLPSILAREARREEQRG